MEVKRGNCKKTCKEDKHAHNCHTNPGETQPSIKKLSGVIHRRVVFLPSLCNSIQFRDQMKMNVNVCENITYELFKANLVCILSYC